MSHYDQMNTDTIDVDMLCIVLESKSMNLWNLKCTEMNLPALLIMSNYTMNRSN